VIKVGDVFDYQGSSIRIMAIAEGYAVCRRPGKMPFLESVKELEKGLAEHTRPEHDGMLDSYMAARYVGISDHTLRAYAKAGRVGVSVPYGMRKVWRYSKEELDALKQELRKS